MAIQIAVAIGLFVILLVSWRVLLKKIGEDGDFWPFTTTLISLVLFFVYLGSSAWDLYKYYFK